MSIGAVIWFVLLALFVFYQIHSGDRTGNRKGKSKIGVAFVPSDAHLFPDVTKRTIHRIAGDGNCQYGAIAHQLSLLSEPHNADKTDGTEKGSYKAENVKKEILDHIEQNKDDYEQYENALAYETGISNIKTIGSFIEYMRREGTWGNAITLKAASDAYQTPIFVYVKRRPYHSIGTDYLDVNAPMTLSYNGVNHYDSFN